MNKKERNNFMRFNINNCKGKRENNMKSVMISIKPYWVF